MLKLTRYGSAGFAVQLRCRPAQTFARSKDFLHPFPKREAFLSKIGLLESGEEQLLFNVPQAFPDSNPERNS
jgi:hypothetical protein